MTITKTTPRVTTTVPVSRPRPSAAGGSHARRVTPEQHSLPRSIVLHLLPGAGLFGFVLVALLWFYLVSLALMAGAVINALRYELHDTGSLDMPGWTGEHEAVRVEEAQTRATGTE